MEGYIKDIAESLKTADTWLIVITAAIFGALGSLAHRATVQKLRTSPLVYVVGGIMASVGILWLLEPSNAVKLIALSLLTGYGWKAVLNSLENRITSELAKDKAKKTKEEAGEAVRIGKQGMHLAITKLKSIEGKSVIGPQSYGELANELERLSENLDYFDRSFKNERPNGDRKA